MNDKKILFLSNTYPIPARHGVELVLDNLIREALGQGYLIELVIATGEEKMLDDEQKRAASSNLPGLNVFFLKAPRRSFKVRVLEEVSLKRPYSYTKFSQDHVITYLRGKSFNFTWVSSLGLVGFLEGHRHGLGVLVNGLNDCCTTAYLDGFKQLLTGAVGWNRQYMMHGLRTPWLYYFERRILRRFDLIHVQTPREQTNVEWVLGRNKSVSPAIVVACNGKNEKLAACRYRGIDSNIVLIMCHLAGARAPQAFKFLERTWKSVHERLPSAVLWCVGTPPHDMKAFNDQYQDMNAIAKGFAFDLADVYDRVAVAVVPGKQSHGYINRIADAFVAGVPLVANKEPFSTLCCARAGENGIVANTPDEFADQIVYMLENRSFREQIAIKARETGDKLPTWTDSTRRILRAIEACR